MKLRDPHGLGAGESAADTSSIAAVDIGIGIAALGISAVGAGGDRETYDGSHYKGAYDVLHGRFLLNP